VKGNFARRAGGPAALCIALFGVAMIAGHARGAPGAPGLPQVSDEFRDQVRGARGARFGGRPAEFYFTRAIYSGVNRFYDRRGTWAIDHPKADRQFVFGLNRLTTIDAYESDNPVRLSDPELSRFPFLYALEVGYMSMTEPEVEGLRRYLLAGGFLFIDDFWGSWEWQNFEHEIGRVLPGAQIVELALDHPVFHTFYDIERIVQVPSVRIVNGGRTWEQDGVVPYVRGIFDESGRLMVIINWNTDLGDAWEWVDNPYYPIEYSNYAYQLAVNAIVYAMSH
jgi:hypothetical protein